MNSLKEGKKNNSLFYISVLAIFYLLFAFINRQNLFQRFDKEVVARYLRSQDIEDRQNLIKDRIFISDADIYIASGYLYINGAKPDEYNFPHPPLIKYLFGMSSKYFGLPLLPNVFFGAIIIYEVYLLGYFVFKKEIIGLLSSVLLMFDPVFKEVVTYALLDLGQMVFILGFIITSLFYEKRRLLQGILLGLAMASKFYSPVLVFLGLIYLYKIYNKKFNLGNEILVFLSGILVFCLTYLPFFRSFGLLDFIHLQGKIIKFMLDHNKAVEWGGVIKMFFSGYFLWPILFFVNLFNLFKSRFGSLQFLFTILPAAYTIILIFQIPFTRYFILILPFLYLSFAKLIKLRHFLDI